MSLVLITPSNFSVSLSIRQFSVFSISIRQFSVFNISQYMWAQPFMRDLNWTPATTIHASASSVVSFSIPHDSMHGCLLQYTRQTRLNLAGGGTTRRLTPVAGSTRKAASHEAFKAHGACCRLCCSGHACAIPAVPEPWGQRIGGAWNTEPLGAAHWPKHW
jgi:hypothetical protein